jgi:arylsulfatase A-like enzyme
MRWSRWPVSSRVLTAVVALAILGVACSAGGIGGVGGTGVRAASGDAALAEQICRDVPAVWLERIANAYRPDWSGDIQILPRYPNPVDGGLSHAGPWEPLQEVPLVLWGPGYVKPGVYGKDASLTDIAPTAGRLLDFDFPAPDGRVLSEALVPAEDRPLPKLVVTLVWDSAGRDVLRETEGSWPTLASMVKDGAWFEHATVGISNSNTPPGHAAIGTGAYPTTSGVIDEYVRIHGEAGHPGSNGPALLLWPTLGDLYDQAMGNEPVVGAVATLAAHSMMLSHGSMWHGGDRDISVMRQEIDAETGGAEAVEWNLPNSMRLYFEFPEYANQVSSIDAFNAALDEADGVVDGNWRTHSIEDLRNGFDTPARSPYQTQLIKAVVRREGFGADEIPDLLYLNYKATDTTGHLFGLDTDEMDDTVKSQDDALRELADFFDRQVGEGAWILILTADHGSQYPAEAVGGIPIDPNRMKELLYDTFDNDGDDVELFQVVRPTQTWIDPAELEDNGFTLDDIATFIRGIRADQVARRDFALASDQNDDLVYETAFPSRILGDMTCLGSQDPD